MDEEKKPIKLTVEDTIEIPEGKHTGEITKITERKKPYHYIDIHIKPDDIEFELKYGCPAKISKLSKLGKLIAQFQSLIVDKEIDMKKTLVGQRVEFMTMNESTDNGTFARVVENSVKPIAEKEKVEASG